MTQRTAVAGVYIFLLLSMHPMEAFRSIEQQEAFTKFGESQDLMSELHRALHEDTHEANDEYIGESWASCSQRKSDFERRAKKTKARYDQAMEDGEVDTVEAAWVILKARVLIKTLKNAKDKECSWVEEKSVEKNDLEALVAELSGKNKCFPAAKSTLDAAPADSEEEQAKAVKAAITILFADDCKAEDIPDNNVEGVGDIEDSLESEVDEGAEQLEMAAGTTQHGTSMTTQGSFLETLKGDALLRAEGFSPTEITALLANRTTQESFESMLLQVQSSNGLGEIFFKIFGFILLAILWALFCWVILAIFMFILGLIMCLLKMIIVVFIRLFGSQAWDFKYGKCVMFWLGALGHSHSGGDIGIAMCAASMMSGHR